MTTGPNGSRSRLLQRYLLPLAHQFAFLGWVAAAGLSRTAESLLFGVLATCALLRAKALWLELRPARSSVSLKCYTALLVWMCLAVLWRPDMVPVSDSLPGRWFLVPFFIAPALVSSRGMLIAMAVPGVAWTAIGVLLQLGVALPSVLHPEHPSQAFLGLMMLAAAGLGTYSASVSPWTAIIGASMVVASLAGIGVFESRNLAIAVVAALLVASVLLLARRRTVRGLAVLLVIGIFAWSIPSTPLGEKFLRYWEAGELEERNASIGSPVAVYYKANSSGRWRLHVWSLERIPGAWLLGHGGGSWAYDWEAAAMDVRPVSAAPDPTGPIGTFTPTYRWESVPEAESYLLRIRDSTGSIREQWVPSASGDSAGRPCELTLETPLPPGRSSWQVRARDRLGQLQPWSEEWTFVVPVLEAPTPLSPAHETVTGQPEYRWRPVPDATWYQLWIRDANGTVSRPWYRAERVQRGERCTVVPDEPVPDGLNTWWVRAWSKESESGPWSVGSRIRVGESTRPAWHAHQMYLQAVYEYGLVGLGLLLMMLTSVIVSSFKRSDDCGLSALFLVIIMSGMGFAGLAMPSFNVAVLYTLMIVLTWIRTDGAGPTASMADVGRRAP